MLRNQMPGRTTYHPPSHMHILDAIVHTHLTCCVENVEIPAIGNSQEICCNRQNRSITGASRTLPVSLHWSPGWSRILEQVGDPEVGQYSVLDLWVWLTILLRLMKLNMVHLVIPRTRQPAAADDGCHSFPIRTLHSNGRVWSASPFETVLSTSLDYRLVDEKAKGKLRLMALPTGRKT